METTSRPPVTQQVFLHLPPTHAICPEAAVLRLRTDIARLRPETAASRILCRELDYHDATDDSLVLVLTVTAEDEVEGKTDLAQLALALVRRHAVSHVGWLAEDPKIDRTTFLMALTPDHDIVPTRPAPPRDVANLRPPAPVLPRPRRPVRTAARLSRAEAQRVVEEILRRDICGPVERAEVAQLRREIRSSVPGRTAALASIGATTVLLVANAGAAAAQALGVANLF